MASIFKKIAILCLLAIPVAVLGTRMEIWGFKIGLLIIAISFLLSILIFLVCAILRTVHKQKKPQSSKSAATAMWLSLMPVIGIGFVIVNAIGVPRIHNISTDVIDPPVFKQIIAMRAASDNPLEYNVDDLAAVQLAAYPDVKTIYTDGSVMQAHDIAVATVTQLGWEIINSDAITGIIEASDTSRLWGFTDDVVIRLRHEEGTNKVAVDLRSVSRVGQSDLGANAKRITKFIETFSKQG